MARYCLENHLTQRELAGLLGCAHSHAGRILRRESKISFEHALHFERKTAVKAVAVLGLEQDA